MLCEVARGMTEAMAAAAAAAAAADADAHAAIRRQLKQQIARGWRLYGKMEAEVAARLMVQRGHLQRPYGWAAGAPAAGLYFLFHIYPPIQLSIYPGIHQHKYRRQAKLCHAGQALDAKEALKSTPQRGACSAGHATSMPMSTRDATHEPTARVASHKPGGHMSELAAFWAALGCAHASYALTGAQILS
jgi:hypothetical protein